MMKKNLSKLIVATAVFLLAGLFSFNVAAQQQRPQQQQQRPQQQRMMPRMQSLGQHYIQVKGQ